MTKTPRCTHLCISPAVPCKPFHINSTTPASVTYSRNLVRVKKFHIAREGGSRPRADFHVSPPLAGRSMLGRGEKRRKRKDTPPRRSRGLLSLDAPPLVRTQCSIQRVVCQTGSGVVGGIQWTLRESLRVPRFVHASELNLSFAAKG